MQSRKKPKRRRFLGQTGLLYKIWRPFKLASHHFKVNLFEQNIFNMTLKIRFFIDIN